MVPILQLYASDAPGVPFPRGSDLFQVLWCPFFHGPGGEERYPLVRVFWRNAADVRHVLATPPERADAPEGHVPVPCVVHPEQATEYPHGYELPEDVCREIDDRLDRLKEATRWDYHYHLSVAPGTKVGGYPYNLIAATSDLSCERCGGPVEHLLSVHSYEYDGVSAQTWLPVEDRPDDDSVPFRSSEGAEAVGKPHGLELGYGGDLYVFDCRSCPDRPTQTTFYFN
ncbi:DUF1963 domain-containing protein [Nonomuraea sp. JJY05]|uniref:DUF1963 domain-containing protein n=1 Tax=Nonomuraea sp. JJY05 TaxID=3350255 RepID=UPI00373E3CEC